MHAHAATRARVTQFSAERSARLLELESFHFWFGARRRLVQRLLTRHLDAPSTLLDVGCGGSALAPALIASGHRVVGLDKSASALRAARARTPALRTIRGDVLALPLPAASFQAALALDVLEHVDDRSLLHALHSVLATRGILLVTVPALPGLYSYRDEAAGHLRRYTRSGLVRLLEHSGFEVLESHYYQCLLFAPLVLTRILGKHRPHARRARDFEEQPSRIANWLLSQINYIEVELGRFIPWPIGSSLAVVCRKSA